VAETGSTNRDLLAAAAEGAPDGTVLVAAHQTAGRGRRDRTWTAPPGASLLASVLVRPNLPADRLFLLTLACGLAALDAVAEVSGASVGLKWPNDLVTVAPPDGAGADLDRSDLDRKVAGILAESHVVDGRVEAVVVGMGLNLNWPSPLPDELAATATSLNLLTGHEVDLEAILTSWLDHYGRALDDLDADGGASVLTRARERSATLGRSVEVELADRSLRGRAVALTDAGHLVVEPDDGGVSLEVAVGDVVHLRPSR